MMAADQNQPLGGSSPDVGAWPGVAGTVDMGRALFRGIGMNPYIYIVVYWGYDVDKLRLSIMGFGQQYDSWVRLKMLIKHRI